MTKYLIRRRGMGFTHPTGGKPYEFKTKREAWDAIHACEDGPVITGAWEIVEKESDDE